MVLNDKEQHIALLLEQIDDYVADLHWSKVESVAEEILSIDPGHPGGKAYLHTARRKKLSAHGAFNTIPVVTDTGFIGRERELSDLRQSLVSGQVLFPRYFRN